MWPGGLNMLHVKVRDTRLRVCGRSINASYEECSSGNLALSWRADGNEPAFTSITVMAAHPDLYWFIHGGRTRLNPCLRS
jgi:hypothetical protein